PWCPSWTPHGVSGACSTPPTIPSSPWSGPARPPATFRSPPRRPRPSWARRRSGCSACPPWTSRAEASAHPLGQRDGQGPEGPAPVRDLLLLRRRHFGERAAVPVARDEDRVVAEAPITPDIAGDGYLDRALGPDRVAVGKGHQGHGAEAGPAVAAPLGPGLQLGQQL